MSFVSILAITPANAVNTFDCDNTVTEVDVIQGGGVDTAFTINDAGLSQWLVPGENIKLLSFGIFCPHAFVLGPDYPIMKIEANPNGFAADIVYDGLITPFLNQEIEINKHINLEATQNKGTPPVSNTLDLILENGSPGEISMLNVPDIMQDVQVELLMWIKIEHNFEMQSLP